MGKTNPKRHPEKCYTPDLRRICEEMGYGRVIQIVENWMEKKHPGWLEAHGRTERGR